MDTMITDRSGKPIKTLLQAVKHFADADTAHECFTQMRWPDGVVCPRCGSKDVHYSAKYRRFGCAHKHDRRQFTVKTGTIMEDSPLGLDKWAAAFWLEVNAKNSVSSYEVHRALGVTQKSAWFMLHRIRLAIQSGTFTKMGGTGGTVEADETAIGGLAKNMHADRRRKKITRRSIHDKTLVFGLLERHSSKPSRVRAQVVPNRQREVLTPIIKGNVAPGTSIYSDAHWAYRQLGPDYFHAFVDHFERYVDGLVHCNGLENFWCLFKRGIKGTHVSVDPAHLQAYVDSEIFRFNNREFNDGQRFRMAIDGMSGKRLMYKELIGATVSATDPAGPGQAQQ